MLKRRAWIFNSFLRNYVGTLFFKINVLRKLSIMFFRMKNKFIILKL